MSQDPAQTTLGGIGGHRNEPVDLNKTILSDSQSISPRPVIPTPSQMATNAGISAGDTNRTMLVNSDVKNQAVASQVMTRIDDPLVSILVVSNDEDVRNKLMTTYDRLFDSRTAWLDAETLSRGYDLVLKRRPTMSMFDLRNDTRETLKIISRIHEQDPTVIMLGMFDPQIMPKGLDKSELFLEGMRAGVTDFLRIPLAPDEVKRVLERVLAGDKNTGGGPAEQVQGHVVSFFSGKGGVGKTTLVSNVGISLARQFPGQVAVVDSSMDLGNVSDYLGVKPNQSLYDAAVQRDKLDRDLLTSIMAYHEGTGLYLLAGPQRLEHMSGITEQDVTQVLLAVRSSFRYVIVDTLPLFNAISIAVGDLSDSIVVVCEPIVPALNGTRDLLQRFRDVGYSTERIRVLLNKFGPDFNGDVSLDLACECLQRNVDWVLPFDKRMYSTANMGTPYLLTNTTTKVAQQLEQITADVANLPRVPKKSFLDKIFRLLG